MLSRSAVLFFGALSLLSSATGAWALQAGGVEVGEERRVRRNLDRCQPEVGAGRQPVARPPDGRGVCELLGVVGLVEHVGVGDDVVAVGDVVLLHALRVGDHEIDLLAELLQ